MASLDFTAESDVFKEWYSSNANVLAEASASLRTLLSLLLTDHDDFPTPTVTCRVKSRDECIKKFALKYRADLEAAGTVYEIREHITDLVGLRVICLYSSDIPLVRNVLADGFDVIDETDKTQALEAHESVFGYKGLHLDLRLLGNRSTLPEYRRFKDLRFEVQIRTIVQDAWSVLDHKIKYKRNIPHELKRRINRLAALFELADQEFLNIRDETRRLEAEATEAAKAPQKAAAASKLDAFGFLQIVTRRFPTFPFHDHKVDGFVTELLAADPSVTAEVIDAALTGTDNLLLKYRAYQFERFRNRLNPYTTIRHALFASDPEKFKSLLFDLQRATFDSWRTTVDKDENPAYLGMQPTAARTMTSAAAADATR